MSIVGMVLSAIKNPLLNVDVNVMGYLGMAISRFQFGKDGFGYLERCQELYLRTVSDNIYQIKMVDDESGYPPGWPIIMFNGRENAGRGNGARGYVLSEAERQNLTIELGKPLYFGSGNTSEIIEIVGIETERVYFDFTKRTQGRTNSIRKEFYELLYPGQADQFQSWHIQ